MDVILAWLAVLLGAVTVGTVLAAEVAHVRARLRLGGLRDVDLGHYELAYLAGGPVRVADTAIGLLAREGEVRVSRGGKLHRVSTAVTAGYPVEERLVAILAERRSPPVVQVKRRLAESAEVAGIRGRLADLGLLVDSRSVPGFRVCRDVLKLIPTVAVVAAGADVVYMIVAQSPPLSVAALFGFGGSWLVARKIQSLYVRNRPVRLGRAGRHQLEKARRAHPYEAGTDAVAVPLALYGLSHLGDPHLSAELGKRSIPDGHLYPADHNTSTAGCGSVGWTPDDSGSGTWDGGGGGWDGGGGGAGDGGGGGS
ncbi:MULTISPECIES: TIGR04222 domain-containing membrane protein [unclassified Nonomuraea]|uniref:TIGR04222 domain-containing membrane protein n=1 Tax=Nonomuraea sp. NPDC047529 TaxID=3155623 RepID=UPI0033CD4DAE